MMETLLLLQKLAFMVSLGLVTHEHLEGESLFEMLEKMKIKNTFKKYTSKKLWVFT